MKRFFLLAAVAAFIFPNYLIAGGTRVWEVAGHQELDKGEADGTTVSSLGEVTLGLRANKLDLEVGLVWSSTADSKGRVYLGTGYDGKIFRVDGQKITLVAETGQLVVTALAFDKNDDLYASALPDANIFKIRQPQKITSKPVDAEVWTTLPEDVKHVWALAFSGDGRTLFAGTGPDGKLLAIGPDAKVNVYLDTNQKHIMAVKVTRPGVLVVGTSPDALLFEVKGPGQFKAIADFNATEVKAIEQTKDGIWIGVNSFKTPPAVPSKTSKKSNGNGVSILKNKSSVSSTKTGDGAIYFISSDGRTEKRWSKKKVHVSSLAADLQGTIFAGLGADGKVISITSDRVVHTVLDLDERQVMTMLAKKGLSFVATGDAGSAYSVKKARKADAVYYSAVLDAKSTSRFGRITWTGAGKLIVQSRSGNTSTPDDNWSDWSKNLGLGELISSPQGGFLQLRFSWAKDAGAMLRSVQAAYLPLNQRAVITEFNTATPFPGSKSAKKSNKVSKRTILLSDIGPNSNTLALTWKVDNLDGDSLRFRLWYRAVGEQRWRPVLSEENILMLKKYTWDTQTVPDGLYQLKLSADDSPDNDLDDVLTDEFVSVPVLIDNHQPAIKGLDYKKGLIVGTAEDSFSQITSIEYRIDEGQWMPASCKDDILDETKEQFEFKLPSITPGFHAVAVRVMDRAGNSIVDQIHIEQKK